MLTQLFSLNSLLPLLITLEAVSPSAMPKFVSRSSEGYDDSPKVRDDSHGLGKRDEQARWLPTRFQRTVWSNDQIWTVDVSYAEGGCLGLRVDTVVGLYTYSNGSTKQYATVGDIRDDVDAIMIDDDPRFFDRYYNMLQRGKVSKAVSDHIKLSVEELDSETVRLENSLLCTGEIQESSGNFVEAIHEESDLRNQLNQRLHFKSLTKQTILKFGIINIGAVAASGISALYTNYRSNSRLKYRANMGQLDSIDAAINKYKTSRTTIPGPLLAQQKQILQESAATYREWNNDILNGAIGVLITTMTAGILGLILESNFISTREAVALDITISSLRGQISELQSRLDALSTGNPANSSAPASSTISPSPSSTTRLPAAPTAATTCLTRKNLNDFNLDVNEEGYEAYGSQAQPVLVGPQFGDELDIEMGRPSSLLPVVFECVGSSG